MSLLPTRGIYAIAHATASRIEAHLEKQNMKVNFAGLPQAKQLGFVNIAVLARRFNVSELVVFEHYRKVYASTVAEFGQRSPLGMRMGTLLSKQAFFRVLDHLEAIKEELAADARSQALDQVNRPVAASGGMLRVLIDSDDPGNKLEDHRRAVVDFKRKKAAAASVRPYRGNPWL